MELHTGLVIVYCTRWSRARRSNEATNKLVCCDTRRRTNSRTKKSNNAGTNFAKAVTEAMKQDKEDDDENKNKNEPTSSNMAGEP